jgi:TP901 family phage tail tape measure protein
MAQTPDIKIIVGAQKTQTRVQIRSDLTDIVNQINSSKSFPRVKMGLDIAKTKAQIKTDLKGILSGITLNDVKLDLGGGKSITASVEKQINYVKKMLNFSDATADNGFATQIKTIQNQVNGIITQKPQLQATFQELTSAGNRLSQLREQISSGIPTGGAIDETYLANNKTMLDELSTAYTNYLEILSRVKALQGERSSFVTESNKISQAKRSLDTLISSISTYEQYNDKFRKNSGFAREFDDIKQRAQELFATFGTNADKDILEVDKLTDRLRNLRSAIDQAGMKGQTGWTKIRAKIAEYGVYLSGATLFATALNQIKKMISTVTELDAAMTELRKVTNETDTAYNKFFNNAIERSQRLGATLVDTISSSSDMARLDYSLDDASALADTALVYKNVADGLDDIGTASDTIIAVMKAFNVSAEESISIADRFNEIGNNFAISSADIGTAITRSASALKESNNTLDETIGLIVAANDSVRDPESVGAGLKTVAMRLRGMRTELESLGEETDGMATSTSKLDAELKALTGVSIMKSPTELKSTYEIMKGLAEVWSTLNDATRANVLEMVAGKNRSNIVASLLTNWKDAEAVVKTAAESSGSALKENAVYLDSINGRIATFKSSYEALSATVVNDDLIKNTVSSGTTLLNLLNSILKVTGSFPTAISAIVAAYASAKNIGISNMKYALPHHCYGAVA